MSLDRDIERFATAHADELNAADTFALGVAAGIVSRVHAAYMTGGARRWSVMSDAAFLDRLRGWTSGTGERADQTSIQSVISDLETATDSDGAT